MFKKSALLLLVLLSQYAYAINYNFEKAFRKPYVKGPSGAYWLKPFPNIQGKKIRQFDMNRDNKGLLMIVVITTDSTVWRWNGATGKWVHIGTGNVVKVTRNGFIWLLSKATLKKSAAGYHDVNTNADDTWQEKHTKVHGQGIADFDVSDDGKENFFLVVRTSNKKCYRYAQKTDEWLYAGGLTNSPAVGSAGQFWCADAGLWWEWDQYIKFASKDVSYLHPGKQAYPYPWIKGSKISGRHVHQISVDGPSRVKQFIVAAAGGRLWRCYKDAENYKVTWLSTGAGGAGAVTDEGEYWSLDAGGLWRWVDGTLFEAGGKDYIHNERVHKRCIKYHTSWKAKKKGECGIIVDIRGAQGALIAFSTKQGNINNGMYVIELGAQGNTKTFIRKGLNTPPVHSVDVANNSNVAIDGGLPGAGFKQSTYWIEIVQNKIHIGRGEKFGEQEFLSWEDKEGSFAKELDFIGFGGSAKASVDFINIHIE